MYNNIFKTAVIDCDVFHILIESVTHPQSFPCQGKEMIITPFDKGSRLCCSFVITKPEGLPITKGKKYVCT